MWALILMGLLATEASADVAGNTRVGPPAWQLRSSEDPHPDVMSRFAASQFRSFDQCPDLRPACQPAGTG